MTEGMIAVMHRINDLQKRFGLQRSEYQNMVSEKNKNTDFANMIQDRSEAAELQLSDEVKQPGADLIDTNKPVISAPAPAVDMRSALKQTAVSSSALQNNASTYNTRSVIDLIMQDKRAVSNAVEQYTQTARDLMQNSDEETPLN